MWLVGLLLQLGSAIVATMDRLLLAGMQKSVPMQILTMLVMTSVICGAAIFSFWLLGAGIGWPPKAVSDLSTVKGGLFLFTIVPVFGTLCCLFRTSWHGGDRLALAEGRRDVAVIISLWYANVIVGRELGPSFALILLAVVGTLIALYRFIFYHGEPPGRRRHLYLVDIAVSLAAVFWVIPAAQWEIFLRFRLGAGG